MFNRQSKLTAVGIVLITVIGFAAVAPGAVAAADAQSSATTGLQESDAVHQTNGTCEGTPQMSQTSIVSPQNIITADEPGVVEANFRVDPSTPEECTVVVDLEFSFSGSGFQFGGGSDWQQSTTNLVATQFEDLSAGEIRDIRGEIHTNGAEVGDEVTIVADYEIWYAGDRENSIQQNGIRHTIEVEEPNEDVDPEGETDGDSGGEGSPAVLQFFERNLGLLALFAIGIVAVVGLITREPVVNILFGGDR